MYTLLTYRNGKTARTQKCSLLTFALSLGTEHIAVSSENEFEVTNEKGRVVAYAHGEDSPALKQQDLLDAIDKQESV